MILLVEDEDSVRDFITDCLKAAGFVVLPVSTVEELESTLAFENRPSPEVVILDRLLHAKDSSEHIPHIRTKWPGAGVLVLSTIGNAIEKAKVIDLGAEQQMVLELRPAHDPRKSYGFVGVVISLANLSASIWTWYREGSNGKTGEW